MPSNVADYALAFATGFGFGTIMLALQRWAMVRGIGSREPTPRQIDDRPPEVAISEVDLSQFEDLQIRREGPRIFRDASSERGISRAVVKECPECERRVLLDVKKRQPSPTTYCDCGDVQVMEEVNR